MDPGSGVFGLESPDRAGQVQRALGEAYAVTPPRRITVRLDYLDTFDWRIRRKGGRLAFVRDGSGNRLEWQPERAGRSSRFPVEKAPAFAWDLPAGDFRDALEDLVDVRRLIPVVEVRLDCRLVGILDERQKTVARVRSESGTARDPAGSRRRKRIGSVLRVQPVRGYARAYRDVMAWIEEHLDLGRAEGCTLTRALESIGRSPEPRGKPVYDIATASRCDVAMKAILRSLLATMRLNEDGVRRNLDTEFLHDFRVAVRRTRSALGQVPAIFTRRSVDRFRRGFAWLGELTGPVRDLDVQLLNVQRRRRRLAEDDPAGPLLFEAWLQPQHPAVHRRLVSGLDSARYRHLVTGWQEFLDRPVPARTGLANARRPVELVAAERIRRAHRRVLKKGKAIDDTAPPERLHRLRIECKKLRYLLEFFASLYPRADIRRLIDALKQLQDNLGEFNDLAVEQDLVGRYLGHLSEESDAKGTAGRERATQLIAGLHNRQAQIRSEFTQRFKVFSGEKVTLRFRRLFGGASP